jgi:hypothetical protein
MKHFASFRHGAEQPAGSILVQNCTAVASVFELINGKIRSFLLDGLQALL